VHRPQGGGSSCQTRKSLQIKLLSPQPSIDAGALKYRGHKIMVAAKQCRRNERVADILATPGEAGAHDRK
jgi:hypothetical protein